VDRVQRAVAQPPGVCLNARPERHAPEERYRPAPHETARFSCGGRRRSRGFRDAAAKAGQRSRRVRVAAPQTDTTVSGELPGTEPRGSSDAHGCPRAHATVLPGRGVRSSFLQPRKNQDLTPQLSQENATPVWRRHTDGTDESGSERSGGTTSTARRPTGCRE
jgi:hypothetical protein